MKRIASFEVDHDILTKGMYLSRKDGDVVTYDIRMKVPNAGDYLSDGAMHTFEHLFATYARNSAYSDQVVYVGRWDAAQASTFWCAIRWPHAESIRLVQEAFAFIRDFSGKIPGSERRECGNYLDHDLAGAKAAAADMCEVLAGWTAEKLAYPK